MKTRGTVVGQLGHSYDSHLDYLLLCTFVLVNALWDLCVLLCVTIKTYQGIWVSVPTRKARWKYGSPRNIVHRITSLIRDVIDIYLEIKTHQTTLDMIGFQFSRPPKCTVNTWLSALLNFLPLAIVSCHEVYSDVSGIKDWLILSTIAVCSGFTCLTSEYFQLRVPMEGLEEWLDALYTAGIPCAVTSCLDRINLLAALQRMGLKKYFQVW